MWSKCCSKYDYNCWLKWKREMCSLWIFCVCVCVCDRFTVRMKLFSAAEINKNVCLGVWIYSFVKKCVKRECMIKWMYIWICLIVQLFTTVPLLSKFVKYKWFCLKLTTEFVYIIFKLYSLCCSNVSVSHAQQSQQNDTYHTDQCASALPGGGWDSHK